MGLLDNQIREKLSQMVDLTLKKLKKCATSMKRAESRQPKWVEARKQRYLRTAYAKLSEEQQNLSGDSEEFLLNSIGSEIMNAELTNNNKNKNGLVGTF
ncbi:hypothetical protein HHI36_007753 [Cryptolaemus montrouzieri]|uniref:Uncharacterized protein n=1 Tax=Cryptolaemus montrouzieri TaxID=559131 RepID=A0ABD2MQL1_9CUCU